MKVWVLTYEVNEYNQYGEYFIEMWTDKPSKEALEKYVSGYRWSSDDDLEHLLNGGGRRGYEDDWYYLIERDV